MSSEDKMNIDERRKYLRQMQRRYRKAGRKARSQLLDEMQTITGLNRNYLIELMYGDLKRKPRRRQRGHVYGLEVDDVLRVVDESLDYVCAERLAPNLVWLTQHLVAHGEVEVAEEVLEKLGQVSISTVGRILKRIRQDQPRLPRKGPRRANQVTRNVPMKRIPWDEGTPGHFEVDLVHHCGSTASGEYACTLQLIDVATGWSERVAVLGRSYLVMEDAFRRILARLPFPVLEIHPDNGSEFFNHHMARFWGEIVQGVQLSRSRPYQKNDNRNVEQKNATLVRKYLGYERLDSVAQVLTVNRLYERMWLYYNFFQPVMHLEEKTVIPATDGQHTRIKRRYDEARTPFDRLCETVAILPEHRDLLEALRDRTNPRQLRQEIYDLLDHIFSLPGAAPGVPENVFHTLSTSSLRIEVERKDTLITFSFDRTVIRQSSPKREAPSSFPEGEDD